MPRACLGPVCLLLLVTWLMTVSCRRLPAQPSLAFPDLHPMLGSSSATGERKGVVKRSSRSFGSFYRLMQRHSRYLDEQAFVEKMFRLFDMNSDNLIERDEFRAIMQLLGLISHRY